MATNEQTTMNGPSELGLALAGKYLTFRLGNEEYGLQILKVQEINRMQMVTRVPRTPNYLRGVINLRGKVIPVVDLRRKFALEDHEDTERTCIIVVKIPQGSADVVMGIIIDDVREVLDIIAENIEETPCFGANVEADFILGIGKIGQAVKILLDIDKVLSTDELKTLKSAAGV